MTTLLTLTSKQIWPQVLAVAYLKPDRVILLHSKDENESRGPAQRLKRFFDATELVPKGNTRMEYVSDTDFHEVEQRLDTTIRVHKVPLNTCMLNFTGGNKLMATAAFRWAARRGVRSFYLERNAQLLISFEMRDGEVQTRVEQIDGHCTDHLDPVALLRCQLDASEIERPGQTLELNEKGRQMPEQDMFRQIINGAKAEGWLHVAEGYADPEAKEGDALEYAAAAVLLRLGVHRVQRSLRLKVKSGNRVGTRHPHAEIDLLFTWDGKLWIVDCKDQRPVEDLPKKLRESLPPLTRNQNEILMRIEDELKIKHTKALKEDLIAIREMGGLQGRVICLRKSQLPSEVAQYAEHNGIKVVLKSEMVERFRRLLFHHGC